MLNWLHDVQLQCARACCLRPSQLGVPVETVIRQQAKVLCKLEGTGKIMRNASDYHVLTGIRGCMQCVTIHNVCCHGKCVTETSGYAMSRCNMQAAIATDLYQ